MEAKLIPYELIDFEKSRNDDHIEPSHSQNLLTRRGRPWWALIAWLLCLSSCITDYEPTNIEQIQDLLVVDGIITNGETTIKLRRSVGLTDDFTENEFVNNAKIEVERNDGTRFTCANFSDKGEYMVEMGDLDKDSQYRLCISLDGLEYESDYLTPVVTPPIDGISLRKEGPGKDVNLYVSTHDDQGHSPYYRWMYKENWEMKAEMFMVAEYMSGGVHVFDLLTSNNAYYCWGKDSSKVILLGSSDKLTENVISNKKLTSISPSDYRLSIMYHVEVEQYALHREAYDYYFNLQKNIEESGSLFAPIPSEMKGNIRCVTNPNIPVIGFVEVSTVTRIKQFMPDVRDLYESGLTDCGMFIVRGREYETDSAYGYITYDPKSPENNSFAPKRCVDCRRYGSKEKPSWWPTDHL